MIAGFRKGRPKMLDLFCGRFGWGEAFASRGWEVVGIDLVAPPEIPEGCTFLASDILALQAVKGFDFICASSPCEQFSVHGMKHFHPNPPHPEMGMKLFHHTKALCEASGAPYVMENVRAAQDFVGKAVHHCGPFYLWGTGVPPLMPQGIIKGWETKHRFVNGRWVGGGPGRGQQSTSSGRLEATAKVATLPCLIANAVVDYAEAILGATPVHKSEVA